MADQTRDTRPLWLRTKFMLGCIGMVAVTLCVAIGALMDVLDSNSLAASALAIGGLGSVTTWAQGRSDEKRG